MGGALAWHAEVDPAASRILARHWPGVPNLGDITTTDWSAVPRVCVLRAGFPCQRRLGRRPPSRTHRPDRSGLWLHVARAVEALRPCLVVIENVRGLLTSPAGAPGDVEPCPWCLGDTPGQPPLRALGAVLGSLAGLGYDAKRLVLRASDVGAPHRRERTFITAWPANTLAARPPASNSADLGHERCGTSRRGRTGSPNGDLLAADTDGVGRHEGLAEPAARQWGHDPVQRGSVAAAHDTGRHRRHTGPSPRAGATSSRVGGESAAVDGADRGTRGAGRRWGAYAAAVARWERLTRPAPAPTDAGGRLSAAFVEWMQGLDAGWVTAIPGLSRPAQLTALGNGVVPQQAARAVRLLESPFPGCSRCSDA
ncbi:DNA cytosine methyltransferase [Streptomyces albidoflavus]